MKVTISKQQLNKAIQSVIRVVEHKSAIPVLNGIKLLVDEKGMTITGCDTEMMIQSYIPLHIDEKENMYIHTSGQGVLNAQVFNEYVRKISVDELEIHIDDKFQGKIRANKTDLKINGYDPLEFPAIPDFFPDQSFVISSHILKQLIRQTVFAVSSNEQSPILTGVNISLQQGILKSIATDRHRLASIQYKTDSTAEFHQLVISARALQELNKLLPEEDTMVQIMFKDNQILFKFNEILLYSKLLDGTYPDTERIVQNAANFTTEIVISTELLIDTMERAMIMSRKEKGNVVNMYSLDDETIEFTSSSTEFGKFKESLSTGKPLQNPVRVSFNSKFLIDVLKVMDSEFVKIGLSGDMNPIYIHPTEVHDDYQTVHLILPYRTARENV
jgi:DNA polymerase-3 subunit beta